jgi:hypothetical protein
MSCIAKTEKNHRHQVRLRPNDGLVNAEKTHEWITESHQEMNARM